MSEAEIQIIIQELKQGKKFEEPGHRDWGGDYLLDLVYFKAPLFIYELYSCNQDVGNGLIRRREMDEEATKKFFKLKDFEKVQEYYLR